MGIVDKKQACAGYLFSCQLL